jgi:HD-GYP domain-containing protein (c-di-GMP phosphodiesterase class II)
MDSAREMLAMFRGFCEEEFPEQFLHLFPDSLNGLPSEQPVETWMELFRCFQLAFHSETGMHIKRVTNMAVMHAELLGLHESIDAIRYSAIAHDLGKMRIQDLLSKRGKLSDEDWVRIRQHPQDGYGFLKLFPGIPEATLDIVRYHHERYDGTGYPVGLKSDGIPLLARLFSLIDVYDALRFERMYRGEAQARWPREKVLDHLCQHSKTHFDPILTNKILHNLEWLQTLAE